MKRYFKTLLLLLGVQLSLLSNAQKYNFKNYTVANGLGSSSVNHIYQDSRGYIWFSTQGGGASRFNGKQFKNFTKADGLISNDVTYTTQDKQGNIWIATAEGASMFDGTNFTNYNLSKGLTNGVVYCIYADAQNNIWFATQDRGIRIFNGSKFDSVAGLPSAEAYTIAQDKSGNLWFGLANGIVKYCKGKLTDYGSSNLVKDKTFFSSLTLRYGDVWFGSTSGDVVIIHPDNSMSKLELPLALQHDFIGSIAQDSKSNIWLGTDHGLLKLSPPVSGGVPEGRGGKLFTEREGLSVNTVQTVMADYEGNIWSGTLAGGVDLLSSEAFVHYTDKDGLASANITAICKAKNGAYYIGTGNGLFIFNAASTPACKKVSQPSAIEKINISSLSMDSKEQLWISAQEGIFVVEPKGHTFGLKKEYTQIGGDKIVSPLKIVHDTKGNTWIATYGSGIFSINEKETKHYHTKNNFTSDKILTVFQDHASNIWFGTQDAGAIKYDGKTFTTILPKQSVWSIAEGRYNQMFFGTAESGLFCYNGETTNNYSTKNGLSSDYIPVLEYDSQANCLWLGSEKGLNQIQFNAGYQIEKLLTYKEEDGFKSTGINQNGMQVDGNGKLWLGTVNGLWLFNQQNKNQKNTSPKIQLTGIRLNYQKINWHTLTDSLDKHTNLPVNLQLPYNKNHLTFDIQALTTSDVLYTHILEGQDEQWSQPAATNEITYTNINPGYYTFKAKAVTASGTASNEIISFSFTIKPPWWSTWWFRLLSGVAIMCSLFVFIKIRERSLKQQNLILEQTVEQRTLEISQQKKVVEQTLVEKEGLLHEKEILLKEIHHRVKNNLQTISSMLMLQSAGLKHEQAKKAITESQSRVRSIALVHQKLYQTDGLEKVELNAFVKDLTAQIQSLYGNKAKQISIQQNIPETFLLIDKAIPLGLILNELFTNSFKYAFNNTSNGSIDITLQTEEQETESASIKSRIVKLTYRDSGPGLPKEQTLESATTLGLRLIKLLSQQIGASLKYANNSGSEFIFTFTINL